MASFLSPFPLGLNTLAQIRRSSFFLAGCGITSIVLTLVTVLFWLTRRRPAVVPRQPLTWRLFITIVPGMESSAIGVTELQTAIEKKFQISLANSRLVLAREEDRYCAT